MTQRNVKDYGVVGNGTTNDGPALEQLLTQATWAGTEWYFPTGIYVTQQMLHVRAGISLLGDIDAVGGRSAIKYTGPAGVNAVLESYTNVRYGCLIRRLGINANSLANHGIFYNSRIDTGTRLEDVQVSGGLLGGVRLEKGGINVHFTDVRIDRCGGYALILNAGTSSNELYLDHFSFDNQTTGGGFFQLITSGPTSSGSGQNLAFTNGRVEANTQPTVPLWRFQLNAGDQGERQMSTLLSQVNVMPGPGVTINPAILVQPDAPAGDNFTLLECDLRGPIVRQP